MKMLMMSSQTKGHLGTESLLVQIEIHPHGIVIAPSVLLSPVGSALDTCIIMHILKRLAEKNLVESLINVRLVGSAKSMDPILVSRLVLGVAYAWTSSLRPLWIHLHPGMEDVANA